MNISRSMVLCLIVAALSASANAVANTAQTTTAQAAAQPKTTLTKTALTSHDKATHDFHQAVDEQLKSDEYSIIKEERVWVAQKEPDTDTNTVSDDGFWRWFDRIADKLEGLAGGLAFVVKLVLMLGLVAFVWWLYRKRGVFIELFPNLFPTKSASLDVTRIKKAYNEPLADDDELIHQIHSAIQNKNFVFALSLLYRSSLRAMSLDHDLPIKKSDTEGRCRAMLAAAKQHYQGELLFFDRLIDSWQTAAYGASMPRDIGERTQSLFVDWQRIYRQNQGGR